ncbi:MAG: GIY-YIG nuclease family protein [Candidatus Methanoplasma sp.]|jgi:Uri superfamily endonuclease|nr:GIY-YIG nuclease family protein [Candidatus Methanoplasma sp.]
MIRPGTYVLALTLDSDLETEVGRLGRLCFRRGRYCYVGSAENGLDQRIGRHLSCEKKVRWHIDRLTLAAGSMQAYESHVPECGLARAVEEAGGVPVADGFGCSDCKCRTHLFLLDYEAEAALASDGRLSPHAPCRSQASGATQPL